MSASGEPQLFGEVRPKKQDAPGLVSHEPGDRLGLSAHGPLDETVLATDMLDASDLEGLGGKSDAAKIHEFTPNLFTFEFDPKDCLLHGRVRSLVAEEDSPFRLPEVRVPGGLMAGDLPGRIELEA